MHIHLTQLIRALAWYSKLEYAINKRKSSSWKEGRDRADEKMRSFLENVTLLLDKAMYAMLASTAMLEFLIVTVQGLQFRAVRMSIISKEKPTNSRITYKYHSSIYTRTSTIKCIQWYSATQFHTTLYTEIERERRIFPFSNHVVHTFPLLTEFSAISLAHILCMTQ